MKKLNIASILDEDLLATKHGRTVFAVVILMLLLGFTFIGSVNQSENMVQPKEKVTQESVAITDLEAAEDVNDSESLELYSVERVVDGDTIVVRVNGTSERVRLIGIDTPETTHPQRPVECFGAEASNKAKGLLEGSSVGLERDYSQDDRDMYGRLLRYVILEDGTNFNKLMIEDGYAFEYTFRVPYEYQSEFRQAERAAREAGRGLWSANTCNGETTIATGPTTATTRSGEGTACNIKGNISYNTGERIYHVPGGRWYEQTVIDESQGERWFCTEEEAQGAGWRKSSS